MIDMVSKTDSVLGQHVPLMMLAMMVTRSNMATVNLREQGRSVRVQVVIVAAKAKTKK